MKKKGYNFLIISSVLAFLLVIFFWKIITKQTFFWFDFILGNYPRSAYMAETLRSGKLPLWIPFIYGGYPFAGSNPSHFFYPFTAALALFVKNGHLSSYPMELFIIIQIWIGGISMYFLLKEFGLSKLSSLFGAVLFCFSLPTIVRTQHTGELYGLIWIPLIFYTLIKTLKSRSIVYASLSGLVLGICLLGAHPQFYFYLIFVIIAFLLYNLVTGEGRRSIILLSFVILIIGFFIASPRLLPEIEYIRLSSRISKSMSGYAPFKTFGALFFPYLFGKGMSNLDYWGGYKGFWMFVEYSSYIGIVSLILLALSTSVIKEKKIRFFSYLLVFSLLFMFGGNNPLQKLISIFLPGLQMHTRFMPFFVFAASVIGSFSLDNLTHKIKDDKIQALKKISLYGIIAGVIFFIIMEVWRSNYQFTGGFTAYKYKTIFNNFRLFSLFLVLSFIPLLLFGRKRISPTWFQITAIAILFIDLYTIGGYFSGKRLNPDNYYKSNNLIQFLKYKSGNEKFRVDCPRFGYFYANSMSLMHGIEALEGHVANKLERFVKFSKEFEDQEDKYLDLYNVKYELIDTVISGRRTVYPRERDTYLPRAWIVHRAKQLPDSRIIPYMKSRDFEGRQEVILEKSDEGYPIFNTMPEGEDSVSISYYGAESIKLNVGMGGDGYLILSEYYYPGWNVYIDGMRGSILRANYVFRAVPLREGRHEVEFAFRPRSFQVGILLSILGLGWILGTGIARKFCVSKT